MTMKACIPIAMVAGLLLGLTLPASPAAAQEAEVTLEECLAAAARLSPAIRQADGAIDAAQARKKAVRGQFLPTLTLDGNVMVWDKEVTMSFTGSSETTDLSAIPAPSTPYEMILYEMLKSIGGTTVVQEQVTGQIGLTAVQPLTPLWAIAHSYKLAGLGVDLARLKREEALANALLGVVAAFYQFLQVEAVLGSLQESVARLKDHLEQARRLQQAELVSPSDVLKLEVALARLEQAELATRNTLELARAALATQVGWGPGKTVRPRTPELPVPTPPARAVEEAFVMAERERPELRAIRNGLRQLRLVRRITAQEFIPSLAALANYTHAEGSPFREEDSFFFGLTFSWPIWQWGTRYYKMDEAKANIRQAEAGYAQARDYVLLDVKKSYLDTLSALEELKAAQRSIDEAQDNYRMQKLLYEAEYKTSSDLIDAEAALTQARSQHAIVLWKARLAGVGFRKATGVPPSAWLQAE
jgi:outer membrane protein TolC